MSLDELRQKFLGYYERLGYVSTPPAPLIPQNDPTVLFTTAGMQQFKSFYQAPETTAHQRVTSVQPVIRTTDISEVGDATHLTMFEMLGNFIFGEKSSMALKKRAITEAWHFITKELKVEKDRLSVTVFGGDTDIPADTESEGIWQSLGLTDIRHAGREDNFWGPTGEEGPCGPTTEVYIDGVEVWNLVFNEYFCNAKGVFSKLDHIGLDTGSGLERLAATLQEQTSVWEIEPFKSWINLINPEKSYESTVIIDHLRASVFLMSAGIKPGNKGRDYVLRRLLRKAIFLASKVAVDLDWEVIINVIRKFYAPTYQLASNVELLEIITTEKNQFEHNLSRATNYLERWLAQHPDKNEKDITQLAFYMYESFGFPKELVLEYLVSLGHSIDPAHFAKLFQQHQEVSRAGAVKQFKGGLADHNEQTIKHHTAHHLLLAALRHILGPTIVQKGSNITSERLRLDFNFHRKLTEEELKKVTALVNEKIKDDLPVTVKELPKEEALASGALAEFGQKYGDTVTVYSVGDFSKELCGGPHVEKTGQLGRFEILKEEATSQGVRRIKARILTS